MKAAWFAHVVRMLDQLSIVQAHPDVPVVDNLEDIWLVSKLQEERKAKQKEQERAQQLQQYKQVIQHFEATAVAAWQYRGHTHLNVSYSCYSHHSHHFSHGKYNMCFFEWKVIKCDQLLTA